MSGTVWSKFYWADWESDPKLRLCSAAAQGLWMRMLCICAEANGYLTIAKRPLSSKDLAAITGWPEHDVLGWLDELERWGVYSLDAKGRIYSRRMIKDVKRVKLARENGKNGGNPRLGNHSGSGARDKGQPTPPLRPRSQKPEARASVEAPNRASTPCSAKNDFLGPKEVRSAFCEKLGDDWCRAYLDKCAWQDVPERALIPATRTAGTKLVRDGRAVLASLGLTVLEKAA